MKETTSCTADVQMMWLDLDLVSIRLCFFPMHYLWINVQCVQCTKDVTSTTELLLQLCCLRAKQLLLHYGPNTRAEDYDTLVGPKILLHCKTKITNSINIHPRYCNNIVFKHKQFDDLSNMLNQQNIIFKISTKFQSALTLNLTDAKYKTT